MSLDNFDDIKIYEYEKKGTKLIVTTSQKKKLKIFNTKKNEELLLKKIEEQSHRYMKSIDLDESKFVNAMTSITGIIATLMSISVIKSAGIDAEMMYALIADLLLFAPSAFIYCCIEYIKAWEAKNNLFFRHKKEINEHVKANPLLLENINKKTRKEIESYLKNDNGVPAVNINSIKKMRLKEMEELLEKMKFYQECNFETPQDIIENSNNIDELTEIYDSTESVKKKELIPENKRLQR